MFQLLKRYRIEVCWLLLLLALMLMTPRKVSTQPDQALLCRLVMDAEDCDDPGENCVCVGGEEF